MCSLDEILSQNSILYGQCFIAAWASSKWCGKALIYNPACRSLSINNNVWENVNIQKRIIYAALHPCQFLINVKQKDEMSFLQEAIQSPRNYGYEAWSIRVHNMYWEDAGCEYGQVKVVFIEIYENKNLMQRKNNKLLKVYKAYRDGEVIGGNYVEL